MTDLIQNPYRSPASNTAAAGSAASVLEKRQRLVLVLAMYLLAAGGSVIAILRPEGATRLLLSIAMCSIMTYWCVVDSRIRGVPIVRSLHWIIFFTWPLAVPIYLTWSRGLRGFGWALLHALGLYAASIAAYLTTGYVCYGQAWFDALRR